MAKTKTKARATEDDSYTPLDRLNRYVDLSLRRMNSDVSGRIKRIGDHFYCEFGCKEYIFHTADEIGEKVKELVKEYMK